MKFMPEKSIELNIAQPLARVRAGLANAVAEKLQKEINDPAYRPFFGKVTETDFKLSPNTGHRKGYSPVVSGELTEVTESKPTAEDGAMNTRVFTRLNADMKLRPSMKVFSVIWTVLCFILLGLALWLCFAKGFQQNWWTLLIGPALFLIERIVCGIGFAKNTRKVENLLKNLLK